MNCQHIRKTRALLWGLLFSMATPALHAQQQTLSGNLKDYAPADQPLQEAFLKGTGAFPAAPLNAWELGFKAGSVNILSDINGIMPAPGYGIHIRKALGHLFSLRLSYMYGNAQGIGTDYKRNYQYNPAWSGYNGRYVFYNYRTNLQDLSIEGIVNLDNIRFHKSDRALRIYFLAGMGIQAYQTRVNSHNDKGERYNFGPVFNNYTSKTKRDIREELQLLLDDTYETAAENEGYLRAKVMGVTAMPVMHLGAGMAIRLTKRVNLAIEDRFTITRSDLLDGNQWEEYPAGSPTQTRSHDAINYLTAGLNWNLSGRRTPPLWWINPLDYVYGELRNPKMMRLPRAVLPDADGDGVTDQFDLEQTPAGVPVDERGVSRDTDGDGVPDAIDKELITPTQCQPVDKDGVGKCPCPQDCGTSGKK